MLIEVKLRTRVSFRHYGWDPQSHNLITHYYPSDYVARVHGITVYPHFSPTIAYITLFTTIKKGIHVTEYNLKNSNNN